jgi:hypothetical protein
LLQKPSDTRSDNKIWYKTSVDDGVYHSVSFETFFRSKNSTSIETKKLEDTETCSHYL